MTSTTGKQALMLATFAVWAAVAVVTVNGVKFSARVQPVTVFLATKPALVRVTIDGEKLANGYVQTPLPLYLTPGRHRIKVSRDGYVAHVTTVEGAQGESFKMEDVVLQALPEARFATVEVAVQAVMPMYVEIDDGHDGGMAPLVSEDLEVGRPHTLVVYPSWPERDPRFTCKFTPPALPAAVVTAESPEEEGAAPQPPSAEAPYRIKVVKEKKRFTATGCTAVKAKK